MASIIEEKFRADETKRQTELMGITTITVSPECFAELEATLYQAGAKSYLFGDNDCQMLDLGNVQIFQRGEIV